MKWRHRFAGVAAALLQISLARGGTESTVAFAVGQSKVDLHFPGESLPVSQAAMIRWTKTAAHAVEHYLGAYPVPSVDIYFRRGDPGDPIGGGISGVEFEGTRIVIGLDQGVTEPALLDSWVMTHEMFHLALPQLPDDAKWASEGLSDYLEPIARAGIGDLPAERVWGEFARDMPQGLPQTGDQGLDNTHTWARTYWGGTIFWLMADVQIRQRNGGRKSLVDALHAILAAGGNGTAEWSLDQVLDVGDEATGTHVLHELRERYGPHPAAPDLNSIWKDLGVIEHDGRATFDDHAPSASIRRAITQRR
jgi:hypothetical protein